MLRTFLTGAAESGQDIASEATNTFVGMESLFSLLMLALLFGCGIYGLYTVIKLRRTFMLFPNKFLYPGNCKPEECLDEDGFIDYILPRLTILSVAMLILGVGMIVNTYVTKIVSIWIDLAMIVLPFGTFFWYILIQRKAAKDYWNI